MEYTKTISQKELKGSIDIGCYEGSNEISIWTEDFEKVRLFGSKHNQDSMYNWEIDAKEKAKGNENGWKEATRYYGKEELTDAKRRSKKYNVV